MRFNKELVFGFGKDAQQRILGKKHEVRAVAIINCPGILVVIYPGKTLRLAPSQNGTKNTGPQRGFRTSKTTQGATDSGGGKRRPNYHFKKQNAKPKEGFLNNQAGC